MNVSIIIVKAFTQYADLGNPAGVILNADALTTEQMIAITAYTGFSECAFIQKSNCASYRARFFTSQQEIDLCAHATIAAMHVLRAMQNSDLTTNIILTLQTNVGIISVNCYENGFIEMIQLDPQIIQYAIDIDEIATLLAIAPSVINGMPQIVSTGSPKLIIPINSLERLFHIKPDFEGIKAYCIKSGARGFYPFTHEVLAKTSDFHARQFNPLAGINEDPVTGVAAGALCSYLVHNNLTQKRKFTIEQGYLLNKLGTIYVDVSNSVRVGGYAITVRSLQYFLSA